MFPIIILAIRKLLPPFCFASPQPAEPIMRFLCRGWGCAVPRNDTEKYEKLNKIYSSYKNGSLEDPLIEAIQPYLDEKLPPAIAAYSLILLFGIEGNEQNISKSYEVLQADECKDSWVCQEILSFHPETPEEDRLTHIEKAASLGSVICKKIMADEYLSQTPPNYIEAIKYLRQIAVLYSTSWMRKKRGGLAFAKAIRGILLDNKNEWQTLKNLAASINHIPSILWLTDAYLKGDKSIGVSPDELIEYLYRVYDAGTCRYNAMDLVTSQDSSLDRTEYVRFFARMGEDAAVALCSYPELYFDY
ncbi:hypothetical protein GPJ56_002481 [Histomonas meleagridis]|uniref:uncharacterized protein n=1 Tax=Histomonas meleagridis TaxID=135588 RepID=UPI00355A2AAA|nr:hypothetical protein GPJ56_002481 [Histomonas meleagridis]KAH0801798.1 hypothetical protein GO595_005479 [Histomonas meleagridis]